MILDCTLEEDKKTKKIMNEEAPFNPSQAVKDRTAQVMTDFQIANVIYNKPYPEFNYVSLVQRFTLDQTSWNQYPGAASKDPLEAWRSLAFRPIVRNKIISIAAHITASMIYPQIYAQNENDEEDRDAAMVMRDIIEWVENESKYERTFLYTVIAALVNPAAYIHMEYRELYRKIKEIQPDGSWIEKKVLDEHESGFINTTVPVDELWISNIYVHDIQRQPFLIWRKVIDFTTAQQKYGDLENFKYVKPGVQYLYSNMNNLFYYAWDQSLVGNMVEEVIYYNRLMDLELRFVNGILMDDPDRPIQRMDKNYPFVKGGYELFDDGRFFYFKSLAFKLANDEEVVNTMYRMVIDGSYLAVMPPAVVYGNEAVGSSVIAPGVITTIDNTTNPNASFETIRTDNNLAAGMQLLQKVEGSIAESSTDIDQIGRGARTTAFQIQQEQQNARSLLGLFGQMISFMVEDYGKLIISDILQHATVGEFTDVLSPGKMLKFRKFLLPEKTIDGKTKTRRIEFDMNLPTGKVKKSKVMKISQDLKQQEVKLDDSAQVIKVNPDLFRSLKFKCVVKGESIAPKNDALLKSLDLEEYDRAIMNPIIAQNPANLEAVTRDLLFGTYDRTKEDPDKYLKAGNQGLPQSPNQTSQLQAQNQQQPAPPGQNPSLMAGAKPPSVQSLPSAV